MDFDQFYKATREERYLMLRAIFADPDTAPQQMSALRASLEAYVATPATRCESCRHPEPKWQDTRVAGRPSHGDVYRCGHCGTPTKGEPHNGYAHRGAVLGQALTDLHVMTSGSPSHETAKRELEQDFAPHRTARTHELAREAERLEKERRVRELRAQLNRLEDAATSEK
ncbi:MAG: hypothetical protein JO257_05980 [Deltaproteobacteria bacterium]|nr:hypothetical protein [Deltaproteobacteria bacterium]